MPTNERGVCLIAYGEKSFRLMQQCLDSLNRHSPLPICVTSDLDDQAQCPSGFDNVQRSRWAKVTLPQWSPFEQTLYLDADTLVQADVSIGFQMLDDGFDLVLTPSAQQGAQALWHIAPAEREATYRQAGCGDLVQIQCGVFWVAQNQMTRRLFEAWKEEWCMWQRFDQAAFLRAFYGAPVKVQLLGRPFNGGAVIAHRYGMTA